MFVRWESQSVKADHDPRLPGFSEDVVVRRFNAPEALDTRFHEIRTKSAINRVPERSRVPFEWTVNPYRGCSHACKYCFARPTHEYLDFNAGRDFEKEIVVKVNVPEVLRAELARPSWNGAHIAMGTNTDPYQWVEGRYKLMRGIWEAMRDFSNPCSILTKSPLVLRDKDLLCQIAERTQVSACFSVPTLDEKTWRSTEPHTPNPRARLEAVAELNRLGIPTGILIAPLMPGINDSREQVEKIVALATEAGAVHIGGITLWLRGSVKEVFFEWLREHRPDLVERYERLYARGAYLPADERRTIERAAGAPWAGRTYAQRFRHRGGARIGPRGGPRDPAGTGPRGGPRDAASTGTRSSPRDAASTGTRSSPVGRADHEEVVPSGQQALF
jgi:DNA repair photolyase